MTSLTTSMGLQPMVPPHAQRTLPTVAGATAAQRAGPVYVDVVEPEPDYIHSSAPSTTPIATNALHTSTIVCFKKIYNQVWILKSMKIREIWTTKYIEWLVRTRQIVL